MNTYIALLRGINLGKHNALRMADLRALFADLGYLDIQTYIQTGNVIFRSPESIHPKQLNRQLDKAMMTAFGFSVPVILKTLDAFTALINNNPFAIQGAGTDRLHLTFLEEHPSEDLRRMLLSYSEQFLPDRFILVGDHLYIYCAQNYRDTKLGNHFFEKKLKLYTTTRNWNTSLKIHQRASS